MSLVYVNGDTTHTFTRDNVPNLISLNEDETDSGLGSSHSNPAHSPDMSGDRLVVFSLSCGSHMM